MRTDADLTRTIEKHSDTVWRICALMCSQKADAEDAFQMVFIKYATSDKEFNDNEHLKAWLIRVASNQCKDMLRAQRRAATPVEIIEDIVPAQEDQGAEQALGLDEAFSRGGPPLEGGSPSSNVVLSSDNLVASNTMIEEDGASPVVQALAELPPEYREVILLVYYEGYTAVEVAEMLGKPVNTIYTHISRAKKLLKEVLEHG